MKRTLPVSGVWLRTAPSKYPHLKALEVLVEVEGKWRLVFTEHLPMVCGEVGHIAEVGAIEAAPVWSP